jgi:uncharacterized protein YaiE (UPF0345 family)
MRAMLKHNVYFDGKVQSVGFERHGRRLTAGVVDRGEFRFDTAAPERMTVTSGELLMRLSASAPWQRYPAGTAFEIGANTGFDVKAEEPSSYICEFLA